MFQPNDGKLNGNLRTLSYLTCMRLVRESTLVNILTGNVTSTFTLLISSSPASIELPPEAQFDVVGGSLGLAAVLSFWVGDLGVW